jgi:phosphatidylserine/phosphatidylglycerophosphate/cardiolipin synthase-like enzyme
MIARHSSRQNPLDAKVLRARLAGASSYDRIAGCFRSSLLEIAGEELEAISVPIRIICNSDLDARDVLTAQAAQAALRSSWCRGEPEKLPPAALGLIHGKAGLIRYPDGRAITFLGSVNESATAWKLNYELLWEDDSPESIAWVAEEFESLWHDSRAVDLVCCPFKPNFDSPSQAKCCEIVR